MSYRFQTEAEPEGILSGFPTGTRLPVVMTAIFALPASTGAAGTTVSSCSMGNSVLKGWPCSFDSIILTALSAGASSLLTLTLTPWGK